MPPGRVLISESGAGTDETARTHSRRRKGPGRFARAPRPPLSQSSQTAQVVAADSGSGQKQNQAVAPQAAPPDAKVEASGPCARVRRGIAFAGKLHLRGAAAAMS
jgi:hypothetical protein